MVDDDGERLDWGNDDDEQQVPPESYAGYSPRRSAGEYASVVEDVEDAVSLGGDDEDEREFYANHSVEQTSVAGMSSFAKPPSSASYSHVGKRDAQRQSATTPSRTPSRANNSQSPARESRPPNSAGKLPPLPFVHGLPPKPVLVPPLFEQPSEAGTLASSMINRQRGKSNGPTKGSAASDGGDPLPPDWEIRYPRNGGKDAYYYNVVTEESTWTRPILPTSGRSSPTRAHENGGPQDSGNRSPDVQDNMWPERSGRSQQQRLARKDTVSRKSSPPANTDLTYEDRHYRPGEAPTPVSKGNPSDHSSGRATAGSAYIAESSYGRTRSLSPQPTSDGRRKSRSSSPQWDRRGRRSMSPSSQPDREGWRDPQKEFSQDWPAAVSDSNWRRSQEYPEPVQPVFRSPSSRRGRRKNDIEPPIRRRKDDIEPPIRRRKDDIEPPVRCKDDIEPPIRRKDDVEPRIRRKDDIEPRIRRKGDIKPPLRRKDDVEPPLRPLPPRDTSLRHTNEEWLASRQRSPAPHLREPSPQRRFGAPSLPSNVTYTAPLSSSTREPPRYERSSSPSSSRFRDNKSSDNLPLRRGRDVDISDPGYDSSKRRRLDEDSGPPRRLQPELSVTASLPAKPTGPTYPSEGSQTDTSHRKRAPLPPQREQWKNSKPVALVPLPLATPPPPRPNWSREPRVQEFIGHNSVNETSPSSWPPALDAWEYAGYNPVSEMPSDSWPPREPPHQLGQGRSRFDRSGPPYASAQPRTDRDAMDVDGPPLPKANQPSRLDTAGRSGTGGMYSDRMTTATMSDTLPRAPRAMARDGGSYSSVPQTASPTSPYSARSAPLPPIDLAGLSSDRGRPRPTQPMVERRWETNDAGRRQTYSGPNPVEAVDLPPKRMNEPARNLPERPAGRLSEPSERGAPRGAPPPPITGPNSTPIGPRTPAYEGSVVPDAFRSSYRTADNGYVTRRQVAPDQPGESVDPYGKRLMRYSSSVDEAIPERSRSDRIGGLQSTNVNDSTRDRSVSNVPGERGPRERQSRFGPPNVPSNVPPESEPRIWQTRKERETEAARGLNPRVTGDAIFKEPRENADRIPRDDATSWRHSSPPVQRNIRGSQPDEFRGQRSSRAVTPPPPVDQRREEPLLVEGYVVGKLHPDRARYLAPQVDPPERSSKPVRLRRPAKSPDRGYPDRNKNVEDDKARDLPPKPDDSRMGPPRDRSPPPQNGYRPNMKRGSSLLERLNIHDTLPQDGSSLRDRVDSGEGGDEGGSSARSELTMDVDNDGPPGGEGVPRNGGVGGRSSGRRRTGKPRRTRRNGGGP